MIKLLISWAILTLAFLAAAKLLPGMKIKSTSGAIGAAAIFGLLNTFVGWALFLVLGVVSFGIGFLLSGVTWFITTVILLKVTDALSDELELKSTGTAIAAAFIIAIVASLGRALVG